MSAPATGAKCTVYVRNLDERVKVPQLTGDLEAIFSTYGKVLDIVAKTSLKRKGQAFVVFENPDAAARAIAEVNGFELYEKPLKLEFARNESDASVMKRVGGESEAFEKHKRARLAEKERKQAAMASIKQAQPANIAPVEGNVPAKAPSKPKAASSSAIIPDEYLPPNKTLFIQNIPEDYGVDSLVGLFGRYAGFREVRTVPGRKTIAFVEYEDEQSAIDAKQQAGALVLGGQTIKVTYQR